MECLICLVLLFVDWCFVCYCLWYLAYSCGLVLVFCYMLFGFVNLAGCWLFWMVDYFIDRLCVLLLLFYFSFCFLGLSVCLLVLLWFNVDSLWLFYIALGFAWMDCLMGYLFMWVLVVDFGCVIDFVVRLFGVGVCSLRLCGCCWCVLVCLLVGLFAYLLLVTWWSALGWCFSWFDLFCWAKFVLLDCWMFWYLIVQLIAALWFCV